MCGIVGVVAENDVAPILLERLKILEYRGYDAANILIIDANHKIQRLETLSKVAELEKLLELTPLLGHTGIANTNWSRSKKGGGKRDINARIAGDEIGLVQNGLIENSEKLKSRLVSEGFSLQTDTDCELVGYLVYHYIKAGNDFLTSIRKAEQELEGAFAVIFISQAEPDHIKALRRGSSLVIGLGVKGNFIASDHTALLNVAERFIYLEEGDIADITSQKVTIYDKNNQTVERAIFIADKNKETAKKGKYSHFMLKEIYDQPDAILTTLQGRLDDQQVFVEAFGKDAEEYFSRIHRVQIVAMGTSFHAGLVGRYWLEEISGIPCQVDISGENPYRAKIVEPNTLFVTLSQSGETTETLNALRIAKNLGYTATLTIGNAPESSLVRESDLVLITGEGTGMNGPVVKDFSAQLTALALLSLALGRYHRLDKEKEATLAKKLRNLPIKAQQALNLDATIKNLAPELIHQERTLFLGNGIQFPVALEGARKFKESCSIYTETYLADDFKDYQYALADPKVPIIALDPNELFYNRFLPKVLDQKGKLIVFADEKYGWDEADGLNIINLPSVDKLFSPITYIIPMQFLAYHVAVAKGKDIDNSLYQFNS